MSITLLVDGTGCELLAGLLDVMVVCKASAIYTGCVLNIIYKIKTESIILLVEGTGYELLAGPLGAMVECRASASSILDVFST